ncbi:MAG: flavodoxin [Chloroflexi bacterium]|nr:MAG: flavodoxin [Chloroflexota bacterium]
MERKVLVAYASKYGSTKEIAERIGEKLQAEDLVVEVRSAGEVKDLSPYGAVVLGSGVYAGQWLRDAGNLLENHESSFANLPVWLFSSGPTGEGDPVEIMKGWKFPENLQAVADRIGPREIVFFGGAIDPKKLSLPEKLIVRALRAPTGDYRNWDSIEAWASGVAEELKNEA